MNFRITGLSPTPFQPYFGLPEAELESLGIQRYVVDAKPGFPDRIEMVEAEVGETVLLLNHVCQPAMTPYRASHAIFVREAATKACDAINQIPQSMRIRAAASPSLPLNSRGASRSRAPEWPSTPRYDGRPCNKQNYHLNTGMSK